MIYISVLDNSDKTQAWLARRENNVYVKVAKGDLLEINTLAGLLNVQHALAAQMNDEERIQASVRYTLYASIAFWTADVDYDMERFGENDGQALD